MNNGEPTDAVDSGADDAQSLTIRRRFPHPREAVFRAWTDPEAVAAWWGPEGCTASVFEMDVRPGGAWRTGILVSEGKEHFVGGVYREVKAPERLVFTWAWENVGDSRHETVIVLEFFDRGGATELVLTQTRFESVESRDQHNKGWSSSFNCLAQYLSEQ
jgi:uncharacterized protein YndB with AHSA1/START domain